MTVPAARGRAPRKRAFKRLLAPMGLGPGGWADETYLRLALHALDEVAHHSGEIGLLRDLYLREGA